MIIKDLIQPVVGKLRNRTDLQPYLSHFIALAILDLSENIEFEQLKVVGPLTNFVVGQAEYPLSNSIFTNDLSHRITQICSWFIYFNPSGQITPGVDTGKNITGRDLSTVEMMSKILGIPSVYNIVGDKRTNGFVRVGQMPDNPYACQMTYQKQHPFSTGEGTVQSARYDAGAANTLAQSPVYIDDDWAEIVTYAAAEKACDDIGLNEVGQSYHQKLFGYKDKRGNEYPGLITVRQTQQQRASQRNSRAMRPYVRRYT